MKTTIYTCDRCKAESADNKILDLAIISIGVKDASYGSYSSITLRDCANREVEWCIKCRTETGIEREREETPKPLPKPPTIEEMLREIVREELQNP